MVEQRDDQGVPRARPVHRRSVLEVQGTGGRPVRRRPHDPGREHRRQRRPQAVVQGTFDIFSFFFILSCFYGV